MRAPNHSCSVDDRDVNLSLSINSNAGPLLSSSSDPPPHPPASGPRGASPPSPSGGLDINVHATPFMFTCRPPLRRPAMLSSGFMWPLPWWRRLRAPTSLLATLTPRPMPWTHREACPRGPGQQQCGAAAHQLPRHGRCALCPLPQRPGHLTPLLCTPPWQVTAGPVLHTVLPPSVCCRMCHCYGLAARPPSRRPNPPSPLPLLPQPIGPWKLGTTYPRLRHFWASPLAAGLLAVVEDRCYRPTQKVRGKHLPCPTGPWVRVVHCQEPAIHPSATCSVREWVSGINV